jgi:methyl-accepting chemotaxis protein
MVVGPTLVAVNQGPALLSGLPLDHAKFWMTMVVPFLVSCFSGAAADARCENSKGERKLSVTQALGPVVGMVEEVHSNATKVNATAKARFDETSRLLSRARQTVDEVTSGAALVHEALAAAKDVQRQFDSVIQTESEVRTEISASSLSAQAVEAAIALARERFEVISKLAHEIGRIGHQTTLLSLNAAVVAATAGVEGKRFAAIAEAVRDLARETERQAKAIHATTRELDLSATEMARESAQLAGGMRRLLQCSDRASGALDEATAALTRSSETTKRSLSVLGSQSVQIREIADGIGRIVDHAGAAIEGSARNAGLAKDVAARLGDLVESQ